MKIPGIGDVISRKNDNDLYVVVDIENYETYVSSPYDRRYLLCDLSYLEENQGFVEMEELSRHGFWLKAELSRYGFWLNVNGTDLPFVVRTDVAPFAIEPVEYRKIRRKTAKTMTTVVYE